MRTQIAKDVAAELLQDGTRLEIKKAMPGGSEKGLGGWGCAAIETVVDTVLDRHGIPDPCRLCDDGVLQVVRHECVTRQWCFCAKGRKAKLADDEARNRMLGL